MSLHSLPGVTRTHNVISGFRRSKGGGAARGVVSEKISGEHDLNFPSPPCKSLILPVLCDVRLVAILVLYALRPSRPQIDATTPTPLQVLRQGWPPGRAPCPCPCPCAPTRVPRCPRAPPPLHCRPPLRLDADSDSAAVGCGGEPRY